MDADEIKRLSRAEKTLLLKLAKGSGLSRRASGILPTQPYNKAAGTPLSFGQQQLYVLSRFEKDNSSYHISFAVRLLGKLNVSELSDALNKVVRRHEALRTTFGLQDGVPLQYVDSPEGKAFCLANHDIAELLDHGGDVENILLGEMTTPFDFENGPLIRGSLLRHTDREHILIITAHHIIFDAWSLKIFWHEIGFYYGQGVSNVSPVLPKLEVQYADYAIWERSLTSQAIWREHIHYWRNTLLGLPGTLDLPTDYARTLEAVPDGDVVKFSFDRALCQNLGRLADRHGTTLFVILLAGFSILLTRLSNQLAFAIGTAVAHRQRAEVMHLIGYFVNTIPIRIDCPPDQTIGTFIQQVKQTVMSAQQHQDLPFEKIVEIVSPVRSGSISPIIQVMFSWLSGPPPILKLPDIEVAELPLFSPRPAKFDLTLTLQETHEVIEGEFEFRTALFSRSTIHRFLSYLQTIVETICMDESVSLHRLRVMAASERERVLYEFNDTATEIPPAQCIHELFEQQVHRSPEATAVVFEESSLSYDELNKRANRLAHYLRELGVRPDSRVAIAVERGFDMIVGLVAILKAGGAYVPLTCPAFLYQS